MNCKKAIVPVAGFGTRRLPITKAIEKCMLPIGNRPIVDYVVEDCLKAGAQEIIFVVGEQNEQLRRYYGKNTELEDYLARRGKLEHLVNIKHLANKARFHYVTQTNDMPYGTAVPVGLCGSFVEPDEMVFVMMGDDFIYNQEGDSEAKFLLDALEHGQVTAGMLATEVPRERVTNYGVIDYEKDKQGNLLFRKLVEKPDADKAPSNLINISKYIFDKKMFECVGEVLNEPPDASGEFYLIDAINKYVQKGLPFLVLPAKGEYLDGGSLEGWIYANQRVHEKILQPS